MSERKGLNRQLFWLYEGHGRWPWVFRWTLLIFDFATIAYVLVATFSEHREGMTHLLVDYFIGAVIALDLAARFYIARHKRNFAARVENWADLIVVIVMFAPMFVTNFAFLRVLRAVRAIRAFTFIRRIKVVTPFFQRHERVIDRVTNLVVFIFVMAALVYVAQVGRNDGIQNYVDALYFTVTSLTTTGYGDILMQGMAGKLLAIVIMVLGLTLFLHLVRSILEPTDKVDHECENCGLDRHDPDAICCKHCGHTIHIKTHGNI